MFDALTHKEPTVVPCKPVVKVPRHSTDDASRLTALLVGRIFPPIFSLLAPCRPFSPGRAVLCLAFRDRLEPSPVPVLRATFATGC